MPEARPSERRPIVPDPDTSLTRPRRPAPPRQRLWPLKLAVLLLLAMLAGMAWLGWMERERLNAQLLQVTSEMSNVHARFDAEEGRGNSVGALESRLAALEEHNESIVARLAGLEIEVQQVGERDASRYQALDERVDELSSRLAQLDDISTQVERLAAEAGEREALLGAVRTSLNALERAGEEGRELLAARIDALAEDDQSVVQHIQALRSEQEAMAEQQQRMRASLDDRIEALDEHLLVLVEEQGAALEERLQVHEVELTARLDALAEELEDVAAGDEASEAVGALQARLASIETELRELRQEQLSLSAGLEALQ